MEEDDAQIYMRYVDPYHRIEIPLLKIFQVSYVLGRLVGGLFNAFSSEWWSNKHNTHHVHTNQVGVDLDIANDPILHLYIPPPDKEFPLRPYQHLYYHIVYAFLYVSWRAQSFQYAWSR